VVIKDSDIEILFENNGNVSPDVSIILLDWSCRESFHILHYLSDQTAPRKQYEVIWIEYYSKHSSEIELEMKKCEQIGRQPPVDKWIVMNMPSDIYYHKHLMFNVGVIVSKGKIITFCDSDAIVSLTFVENIIKCFKENDNVVLHIDEVRNSDRKFYPFNYPSIEQVIGEGCINWKDGKTTGLLDTVDPLHTCNYGACMAARREDIINIGGADEHIDYLGHICGPYDMTFRLINAGLKESWHQNEFLYHVWHPGTDGKNNYLGPHDGRNVSTTALEVRMTGRVMPLVENPGIRMLRGNRGGIFYVPLLSLAVPQLELGRWKRRKRGLFAWCSLFKLGFSVKYLGVRIRLYGIFLKLLAKQLYAKKKTYTGSKVTPKSIFYKLRLAIVFSWRMRKNNIYTAKVCKQVLEMLVSKGTKDVAIYGVGDITKILYLFTKETPLKIISIYDNLRAGRKFLGFDILYLEAIKGYKGKVIISSFTRIAEQVARLREMGIEEGNIVKLQ